MSPRRIIGLLLALLTILIYLPVCRHGFIVYDDGDYVAQNHIVQAGLTQAGFKWAFTTWYASNWHPLTWLAHMTDCELFGLDPGAHHLVNVLFHAANAVLVCALLWRLTGATWASAMVAALFAWHPLRVESVAWISELKDVLSAFFELLTLLCYARYVMNKSRRDYCLALACFALALLAKPMVVTLPCLLLLLDWWPLQRFSRSAKTAQSILYNKFVAQVSKPAERESAGAFEPLIAEQQEFSRANFVRLALEKWPFFLLTIVLSIVTWLAQRPVAVLTVQQYPVSLRLGNVVLSYGKYLLKTVWPVDLAIFYPLPQQIPWPQVAGAAAALFIITWFVWRLREVQPWALIGWLWFLGVLVPVIGFTQTGEQAMADRYTYVASIGICFVIVFTVRSFAAHLQIKPAALAVLAGLVLAANIGLTENQLSYWHNDLTLFGHAVDATTNNVTAEINYGTALEQNGQRDQALAHYREALRIDPLSPHAHNNLANFLDDSGQTDEALNEYQAALRLDPKAPLAHCNLATLLVKLGRYDEAQAEYQEAVRLQPDNPHFYYLMGKACLRQGRAADAIVQFRHALELDPDDYQTLAFLARTLATDPDPKNRDGAQAVTLAENANISSGGNQPFVLDILAMAYAEDGRFPDAQQIATKAIDLATNANLADLAATLRQHLALYQASQPCRDAFTNAPAGAGRSE